MITGLLIGLGAPFWFDLAKKLAQIRNMFKGRSGVDNYDGESPTTGATDYEDKTEKLINRLVAEALTSSKVIDPQEPLPTQEEI